MRNLLEIIILSVIWCGFSNDFTVLNIIMALFISTAIVLLVNKNVNSDIGVNPLAVIVVLFSACRFKSIFIKLVALECLVNLFICGVGIWTLHIHFPLLLDICIALSLITFLSTAAYCQYISTQGDKNA
jgi:multisubunit Na+/H+ antiporter MnhF subunit